MYKIRTFVFLAALAFCLNGSCAYGMEVEDEDALAHITTLTVGKYSPITDDDLALMTNLTELNLAFNSQEYNNHITGRTLTNHPHLTKLDLSGHSRFKEEHLQVLTNITDLNLNNNLDISIETLGKLSKLRNVNLRHSNITHSQYVTMRVGPQIQLLLMDGST